MKCRACDGPTELVLLVPNQPASVRDFSGKDKPITLRVVKCESCGLVQLDNDPVKGWESPTRSGFSEDAKQAISEVTPDTEMLLHFLEHFPDPKDALAKLGKKALVSVPNYDGRVTEFCIDHLTYFTPDSFRRLLESNGFNVKKLSILDEGDSLYATVERIDYCVWGAGHQSLAAMSLYNMKPLYVIDRDPAKQGKTTPVTHFPIVAPEHFHDDPTDKLVIMAGGYTPEIARDVRMRLGDDYPIYTLANGFPFGLMRL